MCIFESNNENIYKTDKSGGRGTYQTVMAALMTLITSVTKI